MRFNRLKKVAFVAALFAVAVAVVAIFFFRDASPAASLRMAACSFDERDADCLEKSPEWNSGIAFLDSSLAAGSDTASAVLALLWEHWNLRFAGKDSASVPGAVLPLRILENRKSGCVGTVWLLLMLREERNIPVDAVLLPGHVFFRIGGKNFEPNREGYSYTDAEYRQKYAEGPWTGLEFEALSNKRFLGIAAFDLGNAEFEKRPQTAESLRKALAWYRMASDLFPEYPGIATNRRIALSRLDKIR